MDATRSQRTLAALVIGLSTVLLVAPLTAAGPPMGPHIEDPDGDTQHREFGWEEPTLDVTEVKFGWTANDTLKVAVLLPHADTLGPDGSMDPFPGHSTVVDVYWTMNGSDYLARAQFESEDPTFLAGQGIRIHREIFWETGTDIHGETTEQSGSVEAADGGGHWVVIEVDPAAVGQPGPGDLLEAPAFSTYVDHHFPLGDAWPVPHPVGQHHPANADLNDAPGHHFHVPAPDASGDGGGDAGPGAAAWEPVPAVGLAGVLAVVALVSLLVRGRRP